MCFIREFAGVYFSFSAYYLYHLPNSISIPCATQVMPQAGFEPTGLRLA